MPFLVPGSIGKGITLDQLQTMFDTQTETLQSSSGSSKDIENALEKYHPKYVIPSDDTADVIKSKSVSGNYTQTPSSVFSFKCEMTGFYKLNFSLNVANSPLVIDVKNTLTTETLATIQTQYGSVKTNTATLHLLENNLYLVQFYSGWSNGARIDSGTIQILGKKVSITEYLPYKDSESALT